MTAYARIVLTKASVGVQASKIAALRLARGFLRAVFGFVSRAYALAVWTLSLSRNLYRMVSTTIKIQSDTLTREEAALWLLERETVVKWRPAIVDGKIEMRGG